MRITHPPPVISSSYKISSLERISSLQKISSVFIPSQHFDVDFANSAATASSKGHLRSLAAYSTSLALLRGFEQPLCTSKSASKVILGVSITIVGSIALELALL